MQQKSIVLIEQCYPCVHLNYDPKPHQFVVIVEDSTITPHGVGSVQAHQIYLFSRIYTYIITQKF